MELQLFKNDVAQSATTLQGTLAVLPVGNNKKQKIVTGDLTGTVQVFSIKNGELVHAYKSLPSTQKVTAVSLGRARPQRDKIFVAGGNTVRGITKKGKEFYKFNTNLTEAVKQVDVHEYHLWLSGEYVHTHFVESREKDFFLAPDRINSTDMIPLVSPQDLSPMLACKDRLIRVLNGAETLFQAPTNSSPTCIKYVAESHDPHHKFASFKEVLVGTENGTLQQMLMNLEKVRQGFELPNPRRLGSIWSLYSGVDFSKTGTNDIVVGREDGHLEIYDMDETGALQQVFTTNLGESINTLDAGVVVAAGAQDCVAQTFSGKVLAFSPSGMMVMPMDATALKKATKGGMSQEEASLKATFDSRLARLRTDLDELRTKVEEERSKMSKTSDTLIASSTTFALANRLRLDSEEACYVLSVESAVPIFTLALQCNIELQLMDVPSNVAILSRSPGDEASGNRTLATYRCQENTSRLHVKFRVHEGQSGVLQIYVIPQTSPKTCQTLQHTIKPLCLHARIQQVDDTRPQSELSIAGSFTLDQMHGWLGSCLPDVPANLGRGETEVTSSFTNVLLGTQLTCKYSAGESKFSSDSFSTLCMLRDALMNEITTANERVGRINFQPHATALQHALKMLWPKLQHLRSIGRKLQLAEALQELKLQDGDLEYLAPEMKAVLAAADTLKLEAKEQPTELQHLSNLVQTLYVDYSRLTGVNAPKQRLPALEAMIKDSHSTLQQMLDFMQGKL